MDSRLRGNGGGRGAGELGMDEVGQWGWLGEGLGVGRVSPGQDGQRTCFRNYYIRTLFVCTSRYKDYSASEFVVMCVCLSH